MLGRSSISGRMQSVVLVCTEFEHPLKHEFISISVGSAECVTESCFFFACLGYLLFLWFIIGLAWLINAWGWIPILFLSFWKCPSRDQLLDSGPLFFAEICSKCKETFTVSIVSKSWIFQFF